MKNKICVYAICKNESQFVEKWIESMSEADYIIVLDTGSTDDTYEKLKSYSNIILDQKIIDPWRFDVARNESMKLIPTDANILVCTDLDEVFDKGWSIPLKERWDDSKHYECVYKYAWSHNEDKSPARIFSYNKIHNRDFHWEFPVHETLIYDGDTNKEQLNLFNEVFLHHYPNSSKSRSSYLPLLELRAKENPDDINGLIYLAHEYFYKGKYDKSIDILKYILENFGSTLTELTIASCFLFMGDDYTHKKEYVNARDAYLKAIKYQSTYREPYLNLAKMYIEIKNYDLAIYYVKEGLKKSYRHYTWLERDRSWLDEPWDILSLACFYGGYKTESLAYAYKAYSLNKSDERLKNNIELIINNTSDLEYM